MLSRTSGGPQARQMARPSGRSGSTTGPSTMKTVPRASIVNCWAFKSSWKKSTAQEPKHSRMDLASASGWSRARAAKAAVMTFGSVPTPEGPLPSGSPPSVTTWRLRSRVVKLPNETGSGCLFSRGFLHRSIVQYVLPQIVAPYVICKRSQKKNDRADC